MYINFTSHYVELQSASCEVTQRLASRMAPMVTSHAAGSRAGSFRIEVVDGGVVIQGLDSARKESHCDLDTCAEALYHRVLRCLISARPDLLWLHAGVVQRGGLAVVVTGRSGQGKSTIVEQFLTRGWEYLSDEIAPIDPGSGTVFPFPLTPRKRVHQGARSLSSGAVQRLAKIPVDLDRAVIRRTPVRIAGVYFLSYRPHSPFTGLTTSTSGQAAMQLLRNGLNVEPIGHRELEAACDFISQAHHGYIEYSDASQAVDEIVEDCSSIDPL